MIARGRRVTAFAIDLDDFADVNAAYGRDVGDEVLRTTKARLQGTLRPGHIVSPLGGDTFVVVSDTIADEHEARALARTASTTCVARRIGFAAIQVETSASIGIAFANRREPDAPPRRRRRRARRREAVRAGRHRARPRSPRRHRACRPEGTAEPSRPVTGPTTGVHLAATRRRGCLPTMPACPPGSERVRVASPWKVRPAFVIAVVVALERGHDGRDRGSA